VRSEGRADGGGTPAPFVLASGSRRSLPDPSSRVGVLMVTMRAASGDDQVIG
jgi:hypothetical protein